MDNNFCLSCFVVSSSSSESVVTSYHPKSELINGSESKSVRQRQRQRDNKQEMVQIRPANDRYGLPIFARSDQRGAAVISRGAEILKRLTVVTLEYILRPRRAAHFAGVSRVLYCENERRQGIAAINSMTSHYYCTCLCVAGSKISSAPTTSRQTSEEQPLSDLINYLVAPMI